MAQGTPDDPNDPNDPFLAFVREAAEGAYDVLGEMGRSKSGNVVYLARELESGNLVAMKLARVKDAQNADEFNLEVVKTLDGALPGLESKCPECKAVLPDWDRFCFKCGADLSGAGHNPSADEAAQLLAAVKEATVGEYDILGKMDRADGGGAVFFARDLKRGKLVALRLRQEMSADSSQASYSIGETQVFRPLVADLGATQVGRAEDYASLAAPPPVLASQPAEAPARPLVGEATAPVARKRPPVKLIAAGVGAALVALIGFVVFQGGDDMPGPSPASQSQQPAPESPAPAPPPPAPDPAPDPVPPPPVASATPDSATVTLGVPVPSGGRFTVNGRVSRGPSRVAAGSVVLELRAPGSVPVRERVAVRAGQTLVWRPALAPASPAATPGQPPAPPPPQPVAPTCQRAASRGDWTAAVELCRAEANAGDVAAERTFARMNEEGRGMPQDRQQAALWYEKAAGRGDRESQERLGYLYRNGAGVKKDDKKSTEFFRLAAEGGLTAAMLEFGVALDEGRGIGERDAEALTWYRKAADAGNTPAARRMARLYERGDGTARNEAEAAHWYRIAADKGDALAQFALGKLYKEGKGVEKSAQQALEWFKKAAAQGNAEAQDEVRKLEKP